jgi:helicase SWR1
MDRTETISSSMPPRKKRRSEAKVPAVTNAMPSTLSLESVAEPYRRRSGRLRQPTPPPLNNRNHVSSGRSKGIVAATKPQAHVKRIKLIVRPPPPPVTHPTQILPQPAYGGSLSSLLRSYIRLEDKDLSLEHLIAAARTDATLQEKISRLRAEGRLDHMNLRLSLEHNGSFPITTTLRVRETHDIWQEVVDEVVALSRELVGRGRKVAAQCAVAVRGYWEAQDAKEERVRAAEERRLKALAKATIRLVTSEWRKVVFVSVKGVVWIIPRI